VPDVAAVFVVPAYFARQTAGDLIHAFTSASTTTSIIAHLDRTLGTTRLQLVEHRTTETITRTSERTLFNAFDLPAVVTTARVPVAYTYTTDLAELQSLDYDPDTQRLDIVLAPLTWNRPAADVSAIESEQEGSWLRLAEDREMTALRASITDLLHIRAAGKRTNLVASRVDGDSMEPMLSSGDIVVIDRNDKKIVKNRIYAIFYEDGLTAKYLERKKNLLILRPINPTSDVQIIDMYEHPDPIVGRVIGAWKEL